MYLSCFASAFFKPLTPRAIGAIGSNEDTEFHKGESLFSSPHYLKIISFILSLAISSALYANPAGSINIRDFGAKGDGKTVDTKAINDAIDAAAKQGGGTVYFPAGTFLS